MSETTPRVVRPVRAHPHLLRTQATKGQRVTIQSSSPSGMSAYEKRRWQELNDHWESRRRSIIPPNARQLLGSVGERAQAATSSVGRKVMEVTPRKVQQAGEFVIDASLASTVRAVTKLLEFTAEVTSEFSKPDKVIQHHRSNGHDVNSLTDLQTLDLKELDAYTRRMALKWRGVGAAQGGALGALAFIPGTGTLASISLDVLVSHALTAAIATRVAYAYGFDASDPDQQEMIERMVRRAYREIAPKAGTVRQASRAYEAARGRVRWSEKLRNDEKLLAAVEKLMKQFSNGPVHVEKVAAKMPVIAVVTSAGLNQHMLADVAKQARLYAATMFLVEKYGLPVPRALSGGRDSTVEPADEDHE